MKKNKIITLENAADMIRDGQSIMVGGFGDAGYPFELIRELDKKNVKDLTIIGNDGGVFGDPKAVFYTSGKVEKLVITFTGLNPEVSRLYTEGKLDVEFIPQGTFIEMIRCGGHGLGGVLTETGVGTIAENGKKTMEANGKKYILAEPLRANVAFLKAAVADEFGNLIFRYSSRNYNPFMAMAADLVIAEVEDIVDIGKLDSNEIMLSGIFVDHIVKPGVSKNVCC